MARRFSTKKHKKLGLWLRRALAALLVLAQVVFLGFVVIRSSVTFRIANAILQIIGAVIALRIIVKPGNAGYKFMWVLSVVLFPIFGVPFYILSCLPNATKYFGKAITRIEKSRKQEFSLLPSALESACEKAPDAVLPMSYLQRCAGFPVYDDTSVMYFSPGETFHEALLAELEKAERYIFLEYFIINEGKMWDSILAVLKRKAEAGVKVRVLYDEIGCFLTLPVKYPKMLAEYGIECCKFNRFVPFLSTHQNNRDHRKIAVVDGKVAFTGGINLADEYINAYEKHGHWKDSGVLCRGSAAWSFTVMFLEMWEFAARQKEDYTAYLPRESDTPTHADGYVQPYADSPMDADHVGKHVYLHMIHRAKRYLYICTPYLILDDTLVSALKLSAKSGVDVRIITPHKWDKWAVHLTTRSYYAELIDAGVQIYEYTNGFMHSKTFVSDDSTATVGTTNLDYRSLYLHFECGVLLQGCDAVLQVRDDFLRTLDVCQPITREMCKRGLLTRVLQGVLRLFAPLM